MKFWQMMGFMTTGGPTARGHAWNCFSSLSAVACHHSLSDTVLGVVPVHHLIQILTRAEMFCSRNYLRSDTLPYDLTSKNLLAADAAKPTTMYALVIKPDAGRRERRERMCHTRFYKENRMHLICAPGSFYTHMIDKTRVIPLL
jgi:hypothetical protein